MDIDGRFRFIQHLVGFFQNVVENPFNMGNIRIVSHSDNQVHPECGK